MVGIVLARLPARIQGGLECDEAQIGGKCLPMRMRPRLSVPFGKTPRFIVDLAVRHRRPEAPLH